MLVKASACGRVGSENERFESYTVFVMADIAEQLHVWIFIGLTGAANLSPLPTQCSHYVSH